MTTEQTSPRDLNVLLNLGTYQDMSDEEIELVLNYKINQEVNRRFSQGQAASIINGMEQLIIDNNASSMAARNVLKSIIGRTPTLKSVGASNE